MSIVLVVVRQKLHMDSRKVVNYIYIKSFFMSKIMIKRLSSKNNWSETCDIP